MFADMTSIAPQFYLHPCVDEEFSPCMRIVNLSITSNVAGGAFQREHKRLGRQNLKSWKPYNFHDVKSSDIMSMHCLSAAEIMGANLQ